MQTTISAVIKKTKFFDRCRENILDSHELGDPQFCIFCGVEKKVFLNVLAQDGDANQKGVEILKCECERKYDDLKKFLEINFEWLEYPRTIPKLVPDYKGENNYPREQQAKFVRPVKQDFDEMQSKKNQIKWENENSEKSKRMVA